jgi:hypothetical protein
MLWLQHKVQHQNCSNHTDIFSVTLLCLLCYEELHLPWVNYLSRTITRKYANANVCHNVGFEVFTAVVMKSIIFLDMAPCRLLSFNWCFGGTYRPLLACWFLLNLFLRPWRWRRYVPPKRRLKLDGLHGVISQKMILFVCHNIKFCQLNSIHKK